MNDSASGEDRRIGALASLPLFHKLAGSPVLLAGEGDGLDWKIELLSAAGADVRRVGREWCNADFDGVRLAIGAFADEAAAQAFAVAARAQGVPVNVVDRPAFCDFQFGSIVNRSPLVVAISTDGAAPVFGQAIRARIEAMLPQGFADWAAAAKAWRPALREASGDLRRAFWAAFSRRALERPDVAPSQADRDELLRGTRAGGRVSLVGAGPGDPELLTLKAMRLLQSADVILYDHLVSQQVLDFARREAKRMLVGKTGYGPSCKQDDINALMVSMAREGRNVVRLKGGDPGIFGRAGEEIAACRAAQVPFEIVPGVTTAQGAAAQLGISLTHRDHAQRVQFVTGHAKSGALPDTIDWTAVADSRATTIVYMPRHTLAGLRDAALAAGLPPQTPAAAVFSATRPDSRRILATIATLPELLAGELGSDPVIVFIGSVLSEVALLAGEIEGGPHRCGSPDRRLITTPENPLRQRNIQATCAL